MTADKSSTRSPESPPSGSAARAPVPPAPVPPAPVPPPDGPPVSALRTFLAPARVRSAHGAQAGAAMLADALKESALAAGIAAVLFVPILGLVLDGGAIEPHWERPVVAVLAVFAGRLALALAVRSGGLAMGGGTLARLLRPVGSRLGALLAALAARPLRSGLLALVLLGTLPALPFSSNYLLHVMSLTFIYVLLAMGLNIVVGLAGLLDLGYVAFYAVGAYGYALLAKYFGVTFWLAMPAAALIAASAGALLGFPVLRMHGDYLAIVTLGFGEIIRMLLVNLVDLTGGPNGIEAPHPTLFGLVFAPAAPPGRRTFHEAFGLPFSPAQRYVFMYLAILVFMVGAVWVFLRLKHMPLGRAWEALKEDEVAARAAGINPTATKLAAFVMGATFGGVGGAFFAGMEGFINPTSFTFIESAMILAIVVLGGMGSVAGVILAAVGITLLPELFREFGNYRMLVFGLAMVILMVWRPGGLLTVSRRSIARRADAA